MAKNLPERRHTIAVAATERDAIVSVRLYLRQPARVVQHCWAAPHAAAALSPSLDDYSCTGTQYGVRSTHPPRLTTIWVVIEDRSVSRLRLIAMLDGDCLIAISHLWVEWAIFQSPKQ